jgi:endonuclease III
MPKPIDKRKIVRVLLQKHGRTFSDELGIDLKKPDPSTLFRWLCASLLFSARISNAIAMEAAKAITREGWTSPQKMAAARWADRARTLNQSGYARYDERTSTMLGETAELLLEKYSGDLRRLREVAKRDPARERELLKEFKGIGEVGADIFFREVQISWKELAPFADKKALSAARKLHLGSDGKALAGLVTAREFPRLVAALVRCALAKDYKALLEEARQ